MSMENKSEFSDSDLDENIDFDDADLENQYSEIYEEDSEGFQAVEDSNYDEYDLIEDDESLLSEDPYADDVEGDDSYMQQNAGQKKSKGSFGLFIIFVFIGLLLLATGFYIFGVLPSPQQNASLYPQQAQVEQQETINISEPLPQAQNNENEAAAEPASQPDNQTQADATPNEAMQDPLTPLPGEEENVGFFSAEQNQADMPDPLANNAFGDNNAPAAAVVPQPQTNEDQTQATAEVTARLNDMQQALDERFSQLERQISSASAPAVETGINVNNSQMTSQLEGLASAISDIQERLNAMDQKFNDLSGKVENAQEQAAKALKDTSSTVAVPPKKPEVAEKPKQAAPAKVESKPKTTTTSSAPKPAVLQAPAWEIRAIQVGKAVVARRGGQGSREVKVGDTVPGLGKIKDINYRNGAWIISGTQGTIRE